MTSPTDEDLIERARFLAKIGGSMSPDAEELMLALCDRLEGRGGKERAGLLDAYEAFIKLDFMAAAYPDLTAFCFKAGEACRIALGLPKPPPAGQAKQISEARAAPSREGEGWREIAPKDQDDLAQLIEFQSLLNDLRRDEGDSVTLCCDNPDFGGPNNAIECNGAWTDWKDRRFEAESLLAAVRVAAHAKAAPAPPSQGGE